MKKCKIILLRADKFSNEGLIQIRDELSICKLSPEHIKYLNTSAGEEVPFHLYIISDDDCKVGDTSIVEEFHCRMELIISSTKENLKHMHKKVIASTDSSLGLPLITEAICREYVEHKQEDIYILTESIHAPYENPVNLDDGEYHKKEHIVNNGFIKALFKTPIETYTQLKYEGIHCARPITITFPDGVGYVLEEEHNKAMKEQKEEIIEIVKSVYLNPNGKLKVFAEPALYEEMINKFKEL